MGFEMGKVLPDKAKKAQVLNDERVGADAAERFQGPAASGSSDSLSMVLKGQKNLHPMFVGKLHHSFQLGW